MRKSATITTVTQAEREQCAEVEQEILKRLQVLAQMAEAARIKNWNDEKELRVELFDYLRANWDLMCKAGSIVVAKETGLVVKRKKNPPSTSITKLLKACDWHEAGAQIYGFASVSKGQSRPGEDEPGYYTFINAVAKACGHWWTAQKEKAA